MQFVTELFPFLYFFIITNSTLENKSIRAR